MYEDPAIVIKPIAVINDSTSVERCPTFAPKAISIRENSLICATVRPAIKPVLFVYLKNPINPITIIGLPIKINNEIKKKSRRERSFALTSQLYEDIDNKIPAISAPTSNEKPM